VAFHAKLFVIKVEKYKQITQLLQINLLLKSKKPQMKRMDREIGQLVTF
jgi:hypothetical protein